MEIDIRKSVIDNLKNTNNQTILTTINEAMSVKEEKILPGLGVLFELLWKASNDTNKAQMVEALNKALKG